MLGLPAVMPARPLVAEFIVWRVSSGSEPICPLPTAKLPKNSYRVFLVRGVMGFALQAAPFLLV